MATPSSYTIPATAHVTSWKSAAVQVQEKYGRLQTLGYHAGFTNSPFWPQSVYELNGHKAEWQRLKAEEYKAKLETTLALHKRKMERAELYEPPEEVKTWTGWKRKKSKKLGLDKEIDIVGCMERIKAELAADVGQMGDEEMGDLRERVEAVLREFRERIELDEIKNENVEKGLSKVLGLKTKYWKGNEADLPEGQRPADRIGGEGRAYWPGHAEFKVDGDERVKNKGLPRRLPLPRLDMLSKERCNHYFQQYTGIDPNEEVRVITEMIYLTGRDIEPEYQAIAEFQGPIDNLESVKLKYAEHEEEKRKEKEPKEIVTNPAPSILGYPDLPSGDHFIDSRGSGYQGVFRPRQNTAQRPAHGHGQEHSTRKNKESFPFSLNQAAVRGNGSSGLYSHAHYGGHRNAQPPGPMYLGDKSNNFHPKESTNMFVSTGHTGPENQQPYDLNLQIATATHDQANAADASQYEYDDEPNAQRNDNQYTSAEANSQASSGDEFHEPATYLDITVANIENVDDSPVDDVSPTENELRELVGWDFVLDALNV